MAPKICNISPAQAAGRAVACAALGLSLAACGLGLLGGFAGSAQADAKTELAQLRQEISHKSEAYSEAMQATAQAQQAVDDCKARIADIEARIPEAQDKAASAMVTQYKYAQNSAGLLDIVLSSDGFESFISMLTYLNTVQSSATDQVNELVSLKTQLNEENANLEQLLADAQQAEQDAADALADVQAAAADAEARVAAEEEAERQAALAAQQAAAAAAAQASSQAQGGTADSAASGDASDGSSDGSDSGSSSDAGSQGGDAYDGGSADGGSADAGSTDSGSSDSTDSGNSTLDAWASRIDSYLAGTTLAGYGRTFAEAALTYGVDPRWSPAIAGIESTWGAYCFASYNAWGWMSHSFSSWTEAIWAHVEYLGYMYGGQLTMEAANIYCDPGDEWYYAVLDQMNSI